MFPFTIILLEREGGETQETEAKIDPGSKTTGIAIVIKGKNGHKVVWATNLTHRGSAVKANLDSRRMLRRGRRSRKTRYRQARFDNRTRPKGWLPPSLMSRVGNVMTWIKKLTSYCPIDKIHVETVRFDTQLMQNPEIKGVEYQQGKLTRLRG